MTESSIKKNLDSEDRELEKIEDFKKGYIPILEKQLSMAKAAEQLLGSGIASTQERAKLQTAMADISKYLADIQNRCRQVLMEITQNNLEKEAGRDFHGVFTEEINDHRLSFIIFLKIFIYLKRFNLETADLWRKIQTKFMSTGLPPESEISRQFLSYRVAPGLQICDVIQTFCSRMERILLLKKDPITAKRLDGLAVYVPGLPYQLSTVFTRDLSTLHSTTDKGELPDEMSGEGTDDLLSELAPGKKSQPQEDHILNANGGMPWNDSPEYYFAYDPRLLEQERKAYAEVIYIDTHMGADQSFIRSEVIRKFSVTLDKPSIQEIEKAYEQFLTSYFNLVADISALNMGIPSDKKNLFLFHVGPQHFYHLTRRFLQEAGTGTFHLRVGSSKVIKKYIPLELLKKILVTWWRENVLARVGTERDDFTQYRTIMRSIKDSYARLSQKASESFDALPESLRKSKSRQDLFRENINEWMGATNMILFRRFLKKKDV